MNEIEKVIFEGCLRFYASGKRTTKLVVGMEVSLDFLPQCRTVYEKCTCRESGGCEAHKAVLCRIGQLQVVMDPSLEPSSILLVDENETIHYLQ